MVKQGHIFSAHSKNLKNNQFIVNIRKSNLAKHTTTHCNVSKKCFKGRNLYEDLKDAIANCPNIMKSTPKNPPNSPGIAPFKKVMLSEKYESTVFEYAQNDLIYQPQKHEIKFHETDQKLRIDMKKIEKKKRGTSKGTGND